MGKITSDIHDEIRRATHIHLKEAFIRQELALREKREAEKPKNIEKRRGKFDVF